MDRGLARSVFLAVATMAITVAENVARPSWQNGLNCLAYLRATL